MILRGLFCSSIFLGSTSLTTLEYNVYSYDLVLIILMLHVLFYDIFLADILYLITKANQKSISNLVVWYESSSNVRLYKYLKYNEKSIDHKLSNYN